MMNKFSLKNKLNRLKSYASVLILALFPVAQLHAQHYPDFSPIVEKVLPSVVTVRTITSEISQHLSESEGAPPALFDGSRARQLEIPAAYLEEFIQTTALNGGSGFVLSHNGYIVTNAHVLAGAVQVNVILNDGSEYGARIIGLDEVSDLALLKIEAQNLIPAELATDSRELRAGQSVLGLGSPFAFSQSVTAGIISYVERTLPGREGRNDHASYIQTDMQINPGNSGGPIVNTEGKIIGVSSKIFSTTGASIGISFGVPVEVIHKVIPQLMLRGEVARGWLGLVTRDINEASVRDLRLLSAVGAQVTHIDSASPAAESGLRVNDVIVTVNGHIVRNCEEFVFHTGMLDSEGRVEVTAIRNGNYFATELILTADNGQTFSLNDL